MIGIEHAALKRFVRATEEFESKFFAAVEFDRNQPQAYSAPTGEAYVEYLNGKSRNDIDLEERFASPEEVIAATFMRLDEAHPENKMATLYWRTKPEIDYSANIRTWRTYCRFVVSDKPRNF